MRIDHDRRTRMMLEKQQRMADAVYGSGGKSSAGETMALITERAGGDRRMVDGSMGSIVKTSGGRRLGIHRNPLEVTGSVDMDRMQGASLASRRRALQTAASNSMRAVVEKRSVKSRAEKRIASEPVAAEEKDRDRIRMCIDIDKADLRAYYDDVRQLSMEHVLMYRGDLLADALEDQGFMIQYTRGASPPDGWAPMASHVGREIAYAFATHASEAYRDVAAASVDNIAAYALQVFDRFAKKWKSKVNEGKRRSKLLDRDGSHRARALQMEHEVADDVADYDAHAIDAEGMMNDHMYGNESALGELDESYKRRLGLVDRGNAYHARQKLTRERAKRRMPAWMEGI